MMPFPRKSRRNARNHAVGPRDPPSAGVTTPLCGLCADGGGGPSYNPPAYYVEPTKPGVYTPRLPQHQPPNQQQHQQKRRRPRQPLPKTMSGCTASTATTATSSRSLYSDSSSSAPPLAAEPDLCPVTGVHANIAEDYYVQPGVLGTGHYGVVRECVHLATRREFAVKSVDKSKIGRLDHLQREICLLANVDHPGIMRMVDCYEDAKYVHIISEKYTGGELFDRIIANADARGCLSERKAAKIMTSLLEAVAYLHDRGIVHRDVKPENVLFESDADDSPLRLIDFGLSRRHQKGEPPMTNPVGTAYYMSPEVLDGSYSYKCDVWACGIVAYVLLCGFPPFNGGSDAEIQDTTRRGNLQFKGGQWLNKSDDAVDFVKCLLRRDARGRPAAREALRHPWLRRMTSA